MYEGGSRRRAKAERLKGLEGCCFGDGNTLKTDRQRVRLVRCSQEGGGASERLTDAAKEGTEGWLAGGREGVIEIASERRIKVAGK
jgi:hypothetical protein